MDIFLSFAGLFILGILILIFYKKIKKDGGPIFFKHSRIGRDLKEFKIYKFRTMYVDAEERLQEMLKDEKKREEYYNNFKLKDDPRITPIGKFLRESSLDEFPQFINVLKGEMSLVGPRPIVKKELEMYYGGEIGKKVFQIKPGITGMWQSHGRSDVEDYGERIASDLYYIRNWSLWLDIVLLLQTIKYVLNRKGAY
jgi:undecaprenyl-phosphate galactose phosphotransferase